MLRDFVNKIQDMALDAAKKETIEIDGHLYTERDLTLVKPHVPKRRAMNLNSLTSLVANLTINTIDSNLAILPLRIIIDEQEVNVYSDLDINAEREHLYCVRSQNPHINFNEYMEVEKMIIQLQTCFVETENKLNLIQMISRLKKDNSIELADDGVTQVVQLKQGVTSTSEVMVPPLVRLTPIRTFFEVKQPEQTFLVRIDSNGRVALFDAGGGVWKYDCQNEIRDYLHTELREYIEDETIVIG